MAKRRGWCPHPCVMDSVRCEWLMANVPREWMMATALGAWVVASLDGQWPKVMCNGCWTMCNVRSGVANGLCAWLVGWPVALTRVQRTVYNVNSSWLMREAGGQLAWLLAQDPAQWTMCVCDVNGSWPMLLADGNVHDQSYKTTYKRQCACVT